MSEIMIDVVRLILPETRDTLAIAAQIALKATALLVLAFALHALAGRRRALMRSACWNACLVGLLLVPVVCLAFPRLHLPVLPNHDVIENSSKILPPVGPSPDSGSFGMKDETRFVASAAPLTSVEIAVSETPAFEPVQEAAPIRQWRHEAPGLGLGLYLTCVSLLLLRLGLSLLSIRRLRRHCLPVDEPVWGEGLRRSASKIGISRPVQLLMSDRISVPIVVGWRNPAVILPRSLTASAASSLVDAVLLHELAHIRRGDFGWNLVRRFVQALYWPHPLVWPLGRIIGAVREQACDDLCVHVLGGPESYHDSLVEIASGLVSRPEPSLGMAMARSTALAQRIVWIHRTRGASDCVLRWPMRMAVAGTIVSVAGLIGSVELARASAQPVEPAQAPKAEAAAPKDSAKADSKSETKSDAEAPAAIEITVLAKDTGMPLANASVHAYVDRKMEFQRTDEAGKARIDLAGRAFLDTISIDFWADGYVQQRHAFSKYDAEKRAIPANLTIELWPGEETLGGKVVDEQGRPIAGAKVEVWGYLGEKKEPHELAYMVDATTDAQGQWRCRSFRKMSWAYLYLSHPDFLADTDQTPRPHGRIDPASEPSPNEQPFAALRDFTDVQVMKKGLRVEGRVVDESGKPIGGAEVGWLLLDRNYAFQPNVPKTQTDAAGNFALPHTRPGQIVLQIKARGHAPDVKTVTTKVGLEPLAIKLDRPHVMSGRVVDTKGAPIPGCEVLVDSWRGYGGPGFFLKTDAEGRFRWDEAPADGALITVSHLEFESVSRFRVDPAAGEALVTLKRSLNVAGSILDSESGKRINDDAEIEVGTRDPATGQIVWKSGSDYTSAAGFIRVTARDGQIRASLDAETFPDYRLRIRLKGYQPFETRVFRSDEGRVEYDVKLTATDQPQGVAISGVVRRPDGKPLEGATVAVAYDAYARRNLPGVRVIDGAIQRFSGQKLAKTDADGRFALTHEADADVHYRALVVAHPDFYAEIARAVFEAEKAIVAMPWGRIEGNARIGNRPGSGSEISYHSNRILNPGVPDVFASGKTKTDVEGRFVIERVPPGDMRVNRIFEDSANARRWFATTIVKVKPGETSRIELGGKGRPVIARIEMPEGFDPKADYVSNSVFKIESDRPRIPYPKELLSRRDISRSEWSDRWWNSSEGLEYRRNWREFGRASLAPDGGIRVEEVPPGEYELNLTYRGEPGNRLGIVPQNVGYLTMKFTVPEIPGGFSDEPLDLGTLKPMPKPSLKVGQEAPAFDVETLEGKRLKLSDLRGKYVLLDFWATWCGPCIAEIPEMKAVYERFGNDDRFAMVSLSLDAEKDAPRKFVAEKALAWHQGFLGEWANGGVQHTYHVEAIPATFLIGPDGKLVAKDLRGIAIGSAVAQALKSR